MRPRSSRQHSYHIPQAAAYQHPDQVTTWLPYLRRYKEGDYGANAGLKVARDLLEPIKVKFPWISYADLWTLAGATAIEEMGGACWLACALNSAQRQDGLCAQRDM